MQTLSTPVTLTKSSEITATKARLHTLRLTQRDDGSLRIERITVLCDDKGAGLAPHETVNLDAKALSKKAQDAIAVLFAELG